VPTVTFEGLGASVSGAPGESLLELCQEHDLPMETACGGFAACNSCRVRVIRGALTPLDEVERPFLDREDQRLGCQACLTDAPGEVVLRLDPGDDYAE
jgi:ferredoxin